MPRGCPGGGGGWAQVELTDALLLVCSVYSCLVSFIFFFHGDAGLIRLNGIDFEISSSQVNPTKRELISCPGSNYASRVFCMMLNATSS